MTKDLTQGSPAGQILSFAVPVWLGMLFQQFYNIADTVLVGRLLGVKPLAGVGCTGSLSFMVLGFCIGVCAGFAIPIAREFGAGNDSELRRYAACSGWLALIFSAVLTAAVCLSCRRILVRMNTPEDIFEYARQYILVIFLGIPFTFLYNLLAGILRSLGDSRSPVVFLALSAGLNILLDLWFLAGLHMGVTGTALATVISQAVSGIVCLIYMCRRYPLLRMRQGEWKPEFRYMAQLCSMGVPMGLQYSVTAIGSIIMQTAMNGLGSAAVAGATAAQKLHSFLASPIEALGATMAPYTGQNMGAGKPERISRGTLYACLMGFGISLMLFLPAALFGGQAAAVFLDVPDPEVLAYASSFLTACTGGYCLLTMVNVVRFSIQGMGYSALAMVSGFMELLARAAAGLILAPRFGFSGLRLAHPLAWLMADLFLLPAFFICWHRVSKRLKKDTA